MWGPDATAQPSESLEQWDDNAASRSRPRKSQEEFRKYSADEAAKKSIWEAALQTSEAIAATAIRVGWCRPGLSTTWGKLCFYGEPQWAAVVDTLPMGCPWSDQLCIRNIWPPIPTAT